MLIYKNILLTHLDQLEYAINTNGSNVCVTNADYLINITISSRIQQMRYKRLTKKGNSLFTVFNKKYRNTKLVSIKHNLTYLQQRQGAAVATNLSSFVSAT